MGINKENQTKFKEDFFMTMKKTFAGILASIVAISAMATVAETYDMAVNTYKNSYTETYTTNNAAVAAGTQAAAYTLAYTAPKNTVDSITVKVTGLVGAATTATTKEVTFKKTAATGAGTTDLFELVFAANGTAASSSSTLAADFFTTDITSYEVKIAGSKSFTTLADAKLDVNKTAVFTLTQTSGAAANVAAEVVAAIPTPATLVKTGDPATTPTYPTLALTGDVAYLPNFTSGLNSNYLQYANKFFDKAATGTLTLKLKLTAKGTAATNGPTVSLPLGTGDAKNFGLALNWSTSGGLTTAANVTSDSITFSWVDLMAKTSSSNLITDVAYKIDKTFADKYEKIELVGVTYTKSDAPAVTAPTTTTPAPTTTTTTVPNAANSKTGAAAPIALAMIPAAIAVAYVAKKKA